MDSFSGAPIGIVAVAAVSVAFPPCGGPQLGVIRMVLRKMICCPAGHAWRESCLPFLSGVRIGGGVNMLLALLLPTAGVDFF